MYSTSFLVLLSCGRTKNEDNVGVDSIITEEVKAINKDHSDQDKVIADLKFFISKHDFENNSEKYLKDIKDKRLSNYNIGRYTAMAYPKAGYENDSLYYVEFRGQPYDFSKYDSDTREQYLSLIDLYKSTYGEPDYMVGSMPSSYSIGTGASQELARWDLGKRSISIRISEWNGFHCINLTIYRNDIMERITKRKSEEYKTKQESASSLI